MLMCVCLPVIDPIIDTFYLVVKFREMVSTTSLAWVTSTVSFMLPKVIVSNYFITFKYDKFDPVCLGPVGVDSAETCRVGQRPVLDDPSVSSLRLQMPSLL